MPNARLIVLRYFVLAVLGLPPSFSAALPAYKEGEVLVTIKSSLMAASFSDGQSGIATMTHVSGNVHKLKLQPDETVEGMLQQLKANPLVKHAQPNYIKYLQTNDPHFDVQWGLKNTGQSGGQPGADINIESAWSITRGDPAVIVAVLDTGIGGGTTNTHPDLKNQLWRNTGEIPGDGIDNDHNGCIDDIIGCDFSVMSGQQVMALGDPVDLDGHGTAVAGVIAAQADNSIGISGVSPDVRLMIVKAFDGMTSTTASVVAAMDYALAMGADIINASYGAPGTPINNNTNFDLDEYNAIKRALQKGVLFVTSAGNGDDNHKGFSNDGTGTLSPYVPASYSLQNIIAVAASDDNDNLAAFSNYGSTSVDLAAPGVGIVSTSVDKNNPYAVPNDFYSISDGTSDAAPFVTGALALMLSVPGDHSVASMKNRLLNSVDSIPSLQGKLASGGRLNAAAALNAAPTIQSLGSGGGSVSLGLLMIAFIAVYGKLFRHWLFRCY